MLHMNLVESMAWVIEETMVEEIEVSNKETNGITIEVVPIHIKTEEEEIIKEEELQDKEHIKDNLTKDICLNKCEDFMMNYILAISV